MPISVLLIVIAVLVIANIIKNARGNTSTEHCKYSKKVVPAQHTDIAQNPNDDPSSYKKIPYTQHQPKEEQDAPPVALNGQHAGKSTPNLQYHTQQITSVLKDYQRKYKDYGDRADTVPYPNYVDYVNCIYCHQPVKPADSYFLTNGMKVHKDCYSKCLHSNGVVEKDVIGKTHAFWDGYPPDWETRKAGVLREAGYKCEKCGKSGVPLTVHHIIPLTKGGSNAFDNLQALCEQCHVKAHGGRDLKQNFDTTSEYIRQTVYQALSGHKNLYISYIDYNGRQTERTIKPYRIISRQNKHILEAYCYLRKANREFRLEHIQKAQII